MALFDFQFDFFDTFNDIEIDIKKKSERVVDLQKTGGESAAVILSLVQTCRAIGVNPQVHLEDVMRRIMAHNSKKLYE